MFGGLLIALFVAVAVAQGIGHPSVPDDAIAVVEDAPDGTVTKAEFDRVLAQTAAGQGLPEVPAEDDPTYQQLADAAQANAILSRWVSGEAAERGIEISDREVEQQLDQIKTQQFGTEKEFDKYIQDSGFCTEEELATEPLVCADVLKQVRLMIISDRIQSTVLPDNPPVADDEVKAYYEANELQFQQPETRDVRVILTKTEDDANAALADLQEDNSEDSYADVAKEFSIDDATKSTGGLRQGVVEGQSEPALDKEIFAATQGDLVGPFKGDAGFYVIEVQKITPATTTSLEDATDQIKQTLVAARQQEIAQTFQSNFRTKWVARTFCADGLPHRRLLQRRARAEHVHRGDRREPGLPGAGAIDEADRSRHGDRVRHGGGPRPAAGSDRRPDRGRPIGRPRRWSESAPASTRDRGAPSTDTPAPPVRRCSRTIARDTRSRDASSPAGS